jgi:hypothetical protein
VSSPPKGFLRNGADPCRVDEVEILTPFSRPEDQTGLLCEGAAYVSTLSSDDRHDDDDQRQKPTPGAAPMPSFSLICRFHALTSFGPLSDSA